MKKIIKRSLMILCAISFAMPVHAQTLLDRLDYDVNEFYQQGLYSEAAKLAEAALKIAEESLPDHSRIPAEVKPIYERAIAIAELYHAQGKYSKAEPLYKRALAIDEKSLGKDHPDVARDLNNLALLYYAEGRYAEAEPLFKRALVIMEKTFGPDHPKVATLLNNQAELYRAEGRYAEAEPLYKRALAIDEKSLGKDHPDVARDLNNLALLYYAEGRYAEAEPLFKRALVIMEKTFGPDHPKVATLLNNQAELYRAEGRYAEAEPLHKRALTIGEKSSAAEDISGHHDKLVGKGKEVKVEESNKQVKSQSSISTTKKGFQSKTGEDKVKVKEKSSELLRSSKAVFTVQAGAFRNASYAKIFMTWLKEKGYDAYIATPMSKEEGGLYKVCIGRFIEREKAVALSEKIKSNEGLRTFITTR